jgi:hypothetical protein
LKRDRDHIAEVGFYETVGRVLVSLAGTKRELVLNFTRQLGDGPYLLDVSIE